MQLTAQAIAIAMQCNKHANAVMLCFLYEKVKNDISGNGNSVKFIYKKLYGISSLKRNSLINIDFYV